MLPHFQLSAASGWILLFGHYDGRQKHRVSYTRSKFISDKMTFGEEQYRPGRSDRQCDLLSRCTYYPLVKAHVVRVEQPGSESDAWKRYLLYNSHGFTHPGIGRISNSIRTYVYAILGARVLLVVLDPLLMHKENSSILQKQRFKAF